MWILSVMLLVLALWAALHLILRQPPILTPYAISHRGAAGLAPENTLAAIDAGLASEAGAIEIDIRQSADGTWIVMHDATVDRTTNGSGPVRGFTTAEIQALDAGNGEPVPTLDEVLARMSGQPARLVVEVKLPGNDPALIEGLAAILNAASDVNLIVVSFDHDWLARFHEAAPDIPLGLLALGPLPPASQPGTRMVDVHWEAVILNPTLVPTVHSRGQQVAVWTVNIPWQMRLMRWLGVDAVTTDRPDLWAQTDR